MRAPLELKKTLNLPRTDFSMKANLPQNEPKWLERWEKMGIYARIRESRQGAPTYILHDGPPYANGAIHEGHALNKCLKDFVVKSKTMAGFDSPYVPGWDCHGLPIEIKVDEALGRKKLEMPAFAVRTKCREYAEKYLNIQRDQFKRLGILGRWEQPYSTMSAQYESVIVRQLFDFMEGGAVYKGLRPVYWCIHDKTALAEAEIEYADRTSPSVWVKYRLTSDPETIDPALAGKNVFTIIWTTTPWTLPASMAVAFHPELEYVALEHGDEVYIVADALAGATRDALKLHAHKIAHFPGTRLEYATFAHPFLDREILGVLAEYVTTDQGTGAVHTAPSHGADDFYTGAKYKLDQRTNVDEAGRLHNGLPEYEGKTVFQANQPIIELLKLRGALMAESKIEHSYPHCWRCHNPVIFRATEQWFISMEAPVDGSTLRRRSLDEIRKVKWIPAWGEERISNMIAERPDWCISRQRVWGVPIAVFFCEGCGKLLDTKEAHNAVVDLFAREGADAWYTREAEVILPAGTRCTGCNGSAFRKETDIIDVWFESGSSHAAVLGHEPGLTWPADLYLEGGDQYRGWFHSSLLVAVGTRGHAPYRGVATNGWTLDPQGRATSKSLGNGVDPIEIAKKVGGEIVRLWVASIDFQEDVTISHELLEQQVAENYKKLRNTFRYVLSNLPDFHPEKHALAFDDLHPVDKYWLLRMAQVSDQARKWYEDFAFHRIYHQLNDFMVDLSREYIDVVKDRLYTAAPNSRARRAAQTALWRIGEALVRLVAPIMSFTADEVWASLPKVSGRPESVHLAYFPKAEEITGPVADAARANALWKDFETLTRVRDVALKALEIARQDKLIGSALEAVVSVVAPEELAPLLERYREDLRFMLIVSGVEVSRGSGGNGNAPLHVSVKKAPGEKCERCWNYSVQVGKDQRYPTVCERCSKSLEEVERELPE